MIQAQVTLRTTLDSGCPIGGWLAVVLLATVMLSGFAQAQTYSVLYDFGQSGTDASYPKNPGILAQGRDGNLYGTTPSGGATDQGAVYKITPAGVLTVLYSFDGTHGSAPTGGLILGTDGNLYGAASGGGSDDMGTIFKITQAGTLTVIYDFQGTGDGCGPIAAPIQGNDGNLYGTTSGCGTSGYGGIYKLTTAGVLTPLYSFDFGHGENPQAPLVQGSDGNLYGTTLGGGTQGEGVIFKITTGGNLTVLFNFDTTHGNAPYSALIQGTDGNYYGTTYSGGADNAGTVFKMTPSGIVNVLHSFGVGTDGSAPVAGLFQAADGNLYGGAALGGSSGNGILFRIAPSGSGYSILYTFDGTSGSRPPSAPYQHTNGTLYGPTYLGGSANQGVFYSLGEGLGPFVKLVSPSANVNGTIEVLGQGFTGTTSVTIDGISATFNVSSNTFMTVTVPSGATTGFVSVTTPSRTFKSITKLQVMPAILSFNPLSGPAGTAVTITGTSFTGATKVTFGGVAATTFTVNSDTQVTADVPRSATTGKIQIATPGGTATSAKSFTVSGTLPLKASSNHRYLTYQNGTPFLLMGDSPQSLLGNVSAADQATYMADRQARGFNAILVMALCDNYTGCASDGATYDGVIPFTKGSSPSNYDLSTPNSTYFAKLDALVRLAASYGLVVVLDPIETGGWLVTLENNGATKAYNYGAFLGSRYKDFPNIVWESGNDFQTWKTSSTDNNLVYQVMAGIANADQNHLQTIELNYWSSYANQDTAELASVLTLDSAYTYYETYDIVLQSYNSSPTIPTFMTEANYEYENNTGSFPGVAGAYVLREQEYWTLLSGATGQLYGSHYTWQTTSAGSNWLLYLDSPGALQIQYLDGLFNEFAWSNLVPDSSHQVVTAGYGTYDGANEDLPAASYCTTAWIPSGALALVYCPNSTTLTVNLAKFSGAVTARWYDPSNGTFTAITGSPFANKGSHQFTLPGENQDGNPDWVLVLQP
jgi:uncharacterized repeat protein (TIGR03803 family)